MLPGLTSAHTRSSYHNASRPDSTGARLSIERIVTSPADFILAEDTGLWLLPVSVAEKDLTQDIVHLDWVTDDLKFRSDSNSHRLRMEKLNRVLSRSRISKEGCIEGGLRGKQSPAGVVIELAEFEMRAPSRNSQDDIPHISICGNNDCYNARHHNLEIIGFNHEKQRVELNPFWFKQLDNGEIETIWGDKLPSIEDSLREFIKFQRSQFPYVPYANSFLTPSPISQISFHPLTGCWEAQMYERNTSGLANLKNGYGQMYARQGPDELDVTTGELKKGYRRGSVLAHNLIWVASGRNLDRSKDRNHLCNYTRCCNPLHIEQIYPEDNRKHGQSARAIIRQQERTIPGSKAAFLTKARISKLFVPVRQLYLKIAEEVDNAA